MKRRVRTNRSSFLIFLNQFAFNESLYPRSLTMMSVHLINGSSTVPYIVMSISFASVYKDSTIFIAVKNQLNVINSVFNLFIF